MSSTPLPRYAPGASRSGKPSHLPDNRRKRQSLCAPISRVRPRASSPRPEAARDLRRIYSLMPMRFVNGPCVAKSGERDRIGIRRSRGGHPQRMPVAVDDEHASLDQLGIAVFEFGPNAVVGVGVGKARQGKLGVSHFRGIRPFFKRQFEMVERTLVTPSAMATRVALLPASHGTSTGTLWRGFPAGVDLSLLPQLHPTERPSHSTREIRNHFMALT